MRVLLRKRSLLLLVSFAACTFFMFKTTDLLIFVQFFIFARLPFAQKTLHQNVKADEMRKSTVHFTRYPQNPWISHQNYSVIIYKSAFIDYRSVATSHRSVIKFFAYKPYKLNNKDIYCLVDDEKTSEPIPANFDASHLSIMECHSKQRCSWKYELHLLQCVLNRSIGVENVTLQLGGGEKARFESFRPQKVDFLTRRPLWPLSVCVPALHHLSNWLNLVLFVEFYRFFGVKHFVFYNYSTSDLVDRVLGHYQKERVGEVRPWPPIPSPVPRPDYFHAFQKTSYYGQLMAGTNASSA